MKKDNKTITDELEEFISESEICRILGVSRSYISTSRKKLNIPHYKIGGLYKYKKAEVMTWMKSRKVS